MSCNLWSATPHSAHALLVIVAKTSHRKCDDDQAQLLSHTRTSYYYYCCCALAALQSSPQDNNQNASGRLAKESCSSWYEKCPADVKSVKRGVFGWPVYLFQQQEREVVNLAAFHRTLSKGLGPRPALCPTTKWQPHLRYAGAGGRLEYALAPSHFEVVVILPLVAEGTAAAAMSVRDSEHVVQRTDDRHPSSSVLHRAMGRGSSAEN